MMYVKLFLLHLFLNASFVTSEKCTLAANSAGSQFATGYSGAKYSVTICKDQFHNFTWNLRFNNGSSTMLASFRYQSDECAREFLMDGYNASCTICQSLTTEGPHANYSCYATTLVIVRKFASDLEGMFLSIRLDNSSDDYFSIPSTHITIKGCSIKDNSAVQLVGDGKPDEEYNYDQNASFSCKPGCSGDPVNSTCQYNATWSPDPLCTCPDDKESTGLSGGAIAGIVIGCLIAVALLVTVGGLWMKQSSIFDHKPFDTPT